MATNAWKKRNPDKVRAHARTWNSRNHEKVRAGVAAYAARNPEQTRARLLWNKAKARAKVGGIPFELSREWVLRKLLEGKCEASGVSLEMTTGKGYLPFAPSLDRNIAGAGYTEENTRVVAYIYNIAKNRWSDDVAQDAIRKIAKGIRRKKRDCEK